MTNKRYRLVALFFALLSPVLSYAQWEPVPGYGHGNMIQLETAAQGRLFALFQGGGLYRSDNRGLSWQQLRPDGTASFNVQSFALTSSNTLAAITSAGIWRSDDWGVSWNLAIPGLPGDGTQRTIAAAGDSLFLARYGVLYRVDLNSGQFSQVHSIEPDYKMYLFSNGPQLWVAPLQGNIRMTPDMGQTWVHYPDDFRSYDICFQGDTVWGVPTTIPNNKVNFVIEGDTTTVFNRPLPQADTYATMSATEGNVFLVYPDRIYRYQPASTSWELFFNEPNVQPRAVKTGEGFQYVSTGSGLVRRAPGSDTWHLCNTGINSGNPSTLQHFDRYLFAYKSNSNGILTPTPSAWITPHEFSAASAGKGPGGLYAWDYYNRLWHAKTNLQEWMTIGPAPAGAASRIFAVGDTLFTIGNNREIFRTPGPGQDWEVTGFVPVAANNLFKRLLILDSILYSCDDNMKFYRLNTQTGQMVQRGTIPGSFVQDVPPFDALPPAVFIRSNKLYYSPNEGQTWIAWPEVDDTGQTLLFRDFVASEAGFFGLEQFPGQIYYAAEPGDTFVRLPFPPMDTLSQPHTNPVFALEYVDGYLYAAQNNGRLYRRKVEKQALQSYSGRIWRDDNNNGQWDTTEAPVAGLVVQRGGFRFGITDDSGRYTITDDLDPDTLQTRTPWPGWTVQPPYRAASPPADTLDFRLTPPFFRNFCVDMSLHNPLRPGFATNLRISWQNLGAADNATLLFAYPGSQAELLSVSPAPDAIDGDTLIWYLANILPAEKGYVTIQMKTDPATPIGEIIPLLAEILPIAGDEVPENNRRIIAATVVGSFDPNDKQAEPAPYTTLDLADGVPLTYTIRFQNTGNYPASFVVIRDTIAENLNLATLQVIAASHPYRLSITGGRILEFLFDPIDLPDSISNEPASHGFVKYGILPAASLQAYNTAYIYFDFNTPVRTNTTETTVSHSTSTGAPTGINRLRVTPNPAHHSVRIDRTEDKHVYEGKIYLFDSAGRTVLVAPANGPSALLQIGSLPAGAYTILWESGGIRYTGKLLRS